MNITQLSVFSENKPGHITAPCRLLAEAGVNIRALSLPDTQPFGILRLIVSDSARATRLLQDAGFVVKTSDVIGVEVPDRPGGMYEVLAILDDFAIKIEYMYAFPFGGKGKAILIFGFNDAVTAASRLKSAGIKMVGNEALSESSM